MGSHINAEGQFQSDKYPTCPPGKVPLSVKDWMAQDLLWEYAHRRRSVDAEFSDDLEAALRAAGYSGALTNDQIVSLIEAAEEEKAIAGLGAAIRDLERDHPLPRCRHGKALRDHGGERLQPPCGCRA